MNELKILNSKIEAFETIDGRYSRVIDLQEGFESITGVKVNNSFTQINQNKASDLQTIYFENGDTLSAKAIGGDMGGGGTQK